MAPGVGDAFVWLRLYQQHQPRPEGEEAMWLTRRVPYRPLTYPAMRRVLQRANARLGTAWTLHDLRHTAARRMIADPAQIHRLQEILLESLQARLAEARDQG